jgi:hypothetical protein
LSSLQRFWYIAAASAIVTTPSQLASPGSVAGFVGFVKILITDF